MSEFIFSFIVIAIVCLIIPCVFGGESEKKTTQRYEQMLHEATVKGDEETAQRMIEILAMRKNI